LNLEERLIRDAESFAAEMGPLDEQELIARVYRALGIAEGEPIPDDAPAAGHTPRVAGPAGTAVSSPEGSSR